MAATSPPSLTPREYWQALEEATGGAGAADERIAAIRQQEQRVKSQVDRGMELRGLRQWDQALEAWEELKQYLKDPAMREFAEAYLDALQQSHDEHLAAARQRLEAASKVADPFAAELTPPLEEALKEAEVALSRLADSEPARREQREAAIRLALIAARSRRLASEPRHARELLVALIARYGDDPRVAEEVGAASCELGEQLFQQASSLAIAPATASQDAPRRRQPGLRPSVRSASEPEQKEPLMAARGKLAEEQSLRAKPATAELMAGVDGALADYHVARAKRSISQRRFATALVHLRAARVYRADHPEGNELLPQALEPVRAVTRIRAGAIVNAVSGNCRQAAEFLHGALESALVGSGMAQLSLLPRDEAEKARRLLRGGEADASQAALAVVSAEIGVCALDVVSPSTQVASKYSVPNPSYPRVRQEADARQAQVDACRRQAGDAHREICAQARSYRDQARSRLASTPQFFVQDYVYTERHVTTTGQIRLSLMIDEGVLKGSRAVGESMATVNETCVERYGVRPDDIQAGSASGSSGVLGVLTGNRLGGADSGRRAGLTNATCPPVSADSKLMEMAQEIAGEAKDHTVAAVRGIADSYAKLAASAADPDAALRTICCSPCCRRTATRRAMRRRSRRSSPSTATCGWTRLSSRAIRAGVGRLGQGAARSAY